MAKVPRINPELIRLDVPKKLIDEVISKNVSNAQLDKHSEIVETSVKTVLEILDKSNVIYIRN